MEVITQPSPLPLEKKGTSFAGTEGVYLLPHQKTEIDRLQRQHELMKSNTDGIQLTVPLDRMPSELKVLDCGCADGTWLLDLNKQHPSKKWSLHGVDIGSALFPANPALDLRQHDITQPYPASWEWADRFDVVHQRLLIWGLTLAKWPTALRNHFDALKPGGYLQLIEAVWIDEDNPAALPELQKQALMQRWSTGSFGMDIQIATKLEDLAREAGFVNVTKTQFDIGYGTKARVAAQRGPSADLWVETFRSLDSKMGPDGIPGVAKTPKEFHEFLDRLHAEISEHGYQPKLNFVTAQKPL